GNVRPTLCHTSNRACDRSKHHSARLTPHLMPLQDQAVGQRLGTRHKPRAHPFCGLQGTLDHVPDHPAPRPCHAARRLDRRGRRLAYQVADLRGEGMETVETADDACLPSTASMAEALAYTCCGADVFCHGRPPERGKVEVRGHC